MLWTSSIQSPIRRKSCVYAMYGGKGPDRYEEDNAAPKSAWGLSNADVQRAVGLTAN